MTQRLEYVARIASGGGGGRFDGGFREDMAALCRDDRQEMLPDAEIRHVLQRAAPDQPCAAEWIRGRKAEKRLEHPRERALAQALPAPVRGLRADGRHHVMAVHGVEQRRQARRVDLRPARQQQHQLAAAAPQPRRQRRVFANPRALADYGQLRPVLRQGQERVELATVAAVDDGEHFVALAERLQVIPVGSEGFAQAVSLVSRNEDGDLRWFCAFLHEMKLCHEILWMNAPFACQTLSAGPCCEELRL